MLYYAKIISLNKYRYSYGRQANKTLRDILIPAKMPMNLNNHMASFYRQKSKTISAKSLFDEKINIDTKNWMEFKLTQLFDIKGSKTTALLELHEYGNGKCPYVTTQATNNGVKGFYDFYSESGNILTIDSAVIGYCSYQEFSFSASDHVEKLIPKFDMNKYIAMFLVTILNAEQYRYNYGLKRSQARMKESYIKLPTKKNIPDWEFMERFIKSLPYASSF
ncbi:MAG: hypothetical protein DRQ51_07160 [Gammaproteobacteria bacterium]|nr:MAG: hypothetical protein DRQ51_07160 [Gammaproteobacteria bacterium]